MRLRNAAISRRQKTPDSDFDIDKLKVDVSWCSRLSFEELKFFGSTDIEILHRTIESMLELELTDVELSYMICQLCLHQVGKQYQGEILEVSEQLQEVLSNQLHDYYTNRDKRRMYSMRIAGMMKINNFLQQGICQRRVKTELMKVFDVFFIEFSEPDMFMDF